MVQHADLNRLRTLIAQRRPVGEAQSLRTAQDVVVTRGSQIVLGPDSATRQNSTLVEPGTFASGPVDLNRLRENLHNAQRAVASGKPADPNLAVGVTRSAGIVTGKDASSTQGATVVEPGTFAAMSSAERLRQETQSARTKLPEDARMEDGGWTYSFRTQYGTQFVLHTKWNGSCYQSWLVAPELEGGVGAHAGHLYSSGLVCLSNTPGSGQPTLETAFAKSVIWAHGVEAVIAGYDFPFSINNL